jgi:hypothetical protein
MTADLVDIFYYARNGDLKPLIEALRREEKKLDPDTELRALVDLAIRLLAGEIKAPSHRGRKFRTKERDDRIVQRERELRTTIEKWEARITEIQNELKVKRTTVTDALNRAAALAAAKERDDSMFDRLIPLLSSEKVEIKDKIHLSRLILKFSTIVNRAIDQLHEKVGLPVNTAPKVSDDELSGLRDAIAKLEDIAGPKKSGA